MSSGGDRRAPDGMPVLRDVIARHGLTARKSMSQNFLLDLNLTRKIARAGGDIDGHTVIEVGPGPGGLTRALLAEGAARVIAIERDERCLAALREIADHFEGRLDVISGDALATDWRALSPQTAGPITIAANLPYAIASPLLVGWLESEPWPPWFGRMVLMFQREVAERIVATPGTKAYGRLSVLSQWRCRCRIAMTLPPEAFTPPPKVSSSVVVFEPRLPPAPNPSRASLSRVAAAAFGQRRKMLRQSLKQLTPFPELLLANTGIDSSRRAEELSVEEFADVAAVLDRLDTTAPRSSPL
jgi:16S rRNA (adenine1518-N6/adenine1519-N6)-dimethyltransferase